MRKNLNIGLLILILAICTGPLYAGKDTTQTQSRTTQQTQQKTKTQKDTGTTAGLSQDTVQKPDTGQNQLQIDTLLQQPVDTIPLIDTAQLIDSALIEQVPENKLTNFKLFLYIILSLLGMALFYYIFVLMLFKTFHRTRGTRQSMLLSWNLFFTVSIMWIFIIWGVVAEFWSSAAFMVTMIFLFIVALVMLIISIKSK